jgi:hypothetical protein
MNVQLPDKVFQRLVAYVSLVMGVLTTVLADIKLPGAGSGALAIFGILLHPDTSVTSSPKPPSASP